MSDARNSDERFRLADPFVCLACGGPVPTGIHICCTAEPDRFTYEVTVAERAERTAALATFMGVTYQAAEKEIDLIGHVQGDYTKDARNCRSLLDGLLAPYQRECNPAEVERTRQRIEFILDDLARLAA